jgi:hypothetical protein
VREEVAVDRDLVALALRDARRLLERRLPFALAVGILPAAGDVDRHVRVAQVDRHDVNPLRRVGALLELIPHGLVWLGGWELGACGRNAREQ